MGFMVFLIVYILNAILLTYFHGIWYIMYLQ